MFRAMALLLEAALLTAAAEEAPGGRAEYRPGRVCHDVDPSDFLRLSTGKTASRALAGKHLRVIELHWPPFAAHNASIPGNAGWTGVDIELLGIIAARLNFTYEIHAMARNEGETWTDTLFRHLLLGDLIGTYWMSTKERHDRAYMMNGHIDSSIVLATPPSHVRALPFADRLFTFTQPFSFSVWLAIALVGCISGLGYYLLEGLNQGDDAPFESIYEAFNVLIYGENAGPSSPLARVHAPLWGFVALVLLSTYTANLTSFMTMRSTRFDKIKSLRDVITLEAPTCMYVTEPLRHEIWRQHPGIRWMYTPSYADAGAKLMGSTDCDAMVLPRVEYHMLEAMDSMCGMQVVGPALISNEAGWVSNVASYCVGHAIQAELQDLYLQGRVTELINKYQPLAACPAIAAENDGDSESVNISDIGGLLLMYLLGLAILILYKLCWTNLLATRTSKLLPGQRAARRCSHAIQRGCFRSEPVLPEEEVTLDKILSELQSMRTEMQGLKEQVNGKAQLGKGSHCELASELGAMAGVIAVSQHDGQHLTAGDHDWRPAFQHEPRQDDAGQKEPTVCL
mmetsp:Transcript_11630/g.32794  ORF Transcript_11630/g.32794 Transcript_11630/m.32794 type:complete len:568 (-) Transcript_11630:168-1871(-)